MQKYIRWAAAAAVVALGGVAAAQTQTSGSANGAEHPGASTQAPQQGVTRRHPQDLPAMNRRVDLSFSDVTLKQAAVLLSKQLGLKVDLDPRLKTTVHVTLEAQNVPVYHVLEALVHQPATSGIMISPEPGGVILQPYPRHVVDGKEQIERGVNPPWSPTWEADPTANRSAARPVRRDTLTESQTEPPAAEERLSQEALQDLTSDALRTPTRPAAPQDLPGARFGPGSQRGTPGGPSEPNVLDGIQPMNLPYPGVALGGPGNQYLVDGEPQPANAISVMITALSDKSFVVTEPGMGPNNEIGYYITLYRIDGQGSKNGEKMRKVSQVFHRSAEPAYPAAARYYRFVSPGYWSTGGGNPTLQPYYLPVAPSAQPETTPSLPTRAPATAPKGQQPGPKPPTPSSERPGTGVGATRGAADPTTKQPQPDVFDGKKP